MRGGRKSHAKMRGRGGRGQGLHPDFWENSESHEHESVPIPEKSNWNICGRNGKAPSDFDRYVAQAASRAGCLKLKPEIRWIYARPEIWLGDSCMSTVDPEQSRKGTGGPRRPIASSNSIEPLRPGAINWARHQTMDSWRCERQKFRDQHLRYTRNLQSSGPRTSLDIQVDVPFRLDFWDTKPGTPKNLE